MAKAKPAFHQKTIHEGIAEAEAATKHTNNIQNFKSNKMKELTINGHTAEVSEEVFHFYQMLKNHGNEPADFNELVFDFTKFMGLWDQFKGMNDSEQNKSEFEKKLDTHILAHTIKPRTQYASQQEKRNGKNTLYPIYYFDDKRVHSMAMGGNYPINECNFYVKTRKGGYVKIK